MHWNKVKVTFTTALKKHGLIAASVLEWVKQSLCWGAVSVKDWFQARVERAHWERGHFEK